MDEETSCTASNSSNDGFVVLIPAKQGTSSCVCTSSSPLGKLQRHSEAQTGKDAIQKGAVSEVKRRPGELRVL